MTLLFCDSFDHYTTMPNVKGWVIYSNSPSIGAYGRNGTNGLHCTDKGYGAMQPLPSLPAAVIVGVAFRAAGLPGVPLLSLMDTGTVQMGLTLTTNGALQVTRGTGTVLGTTGIGIIAPNAYNYIEMQASISTSVGAVTVRLNGNVVLTLTNQNTQSSGAAQVTHVALCGTAAGFGGVAYDYDDLYICDTNGARNNTFLGDVRVQAVLPTGAGNYTQWDGLTGAATHWQAQSQNPPDDDTSYVSDTLGTPGHIDSYAMADLIPTSGTVPAVQVSAWARKDDGGGRTLSPMVRSAAVDGLGAAQSLVTTYGYITSVFEQNPSAGAWTIALVNAAEAGVKAVA